MPGAFAAITTRLLDEASRSEIAGYAWPVSTPREAAGEIERLRASEIERLRASEMALAADVERL